MMQVLFILGLHSLGLLFGCLFRRRVPFAFISASSLLWGSLWYVLAALLLLNLDLPYTSGNMALLAALTIGSLLYALIRQKTMPLHRSEWGWMIGSTLLLAAVGLIVQRYNYTQTSGDSISMIMAGRLLVKDGLVAASVEALALRGAYTILMQSAGTFTGEGYLSFFQTVIWLQFLLVFFSLGVYGLKRRGLTQRTALLFTLLLVLFIFSTEFIVFQAFYIHMNLAAGVFLFTAIVTFWLGSEEQSSAWFTFSTLSWMGFCLSRIESPLFAVVLLALGLSIGNLSYRQRLWVCLPVGGLIFIWHTGLILRMESNTYILGTAQAAIMAGSGAALAALAFGMRSQRIERLVQKALPAVLLAGLLAGLVIAFQLKPEHMNESLFGVIYPTYINTRWGAGWYLLPILFGLAVFQPRGRCDHFLSLGTVIYLLLLILLAYPGRTPYHPNWGGSGNRMLVHIYALPFFYALMKIAPQSPAWFSRIRKALPVQMKTIQLKILQPQGIVSGLLAFVWGAALANRLFNLLGRSWLERIGGVAVLALISLYAAFQLLQSIQTNWQTLSPTRRALAVAGGTLAGGMLTLPLALTASSTVRLLAAVFIGCEAVSLMVICTGIGLYWISSSRHS